MVYACDASPEGHSVQCSLWALSDSREPGLGKEGSRWKLGAEWARHKSLEVAGFLVGENGKLERDAEVCDIKIDRALLDQMRCERWEPDQTFKDISVDFLDPSACKRFDHKCFYKDAMHNFEARTLAKFCDRLGNLSNFMVLQSFDFG